MNGHDLSQLNEAVLPVIAANLSHQALDFIRTRTEAAFAPHPAGVVATGSQTAPFVSQPGGIATTGTNVVSTFLSGLSIKGATPTQFLTSELLHLGQTDVAHWQTPAVGSQDLSFSYTVNAPANSGQRSTHSNHSTTLGPRPPTCSPAGCALVSQTPPQGGSDKARASARVATVSQGGSDEAPAVLQTAGEWLAGSRVP